MVELEGDSAPQKPNARRGVHLVAILLISAGLLVMCLSWNPGSDAVIQARLLEGTVG
jgi:hypothetical protein